MVDLTKAEKINIFISTSKLPDKVDKPLRFKLVIGIHEKIFSAMRAEISLDDEYIKIVPTELNGNSTYNNNSKYRYVYLNRHLITILIREPYILYKCSRLMCKAYLYNGLIYINKNDFIETINYKEQIQNKVIDTNTEIESVKIKNNFNYDNMNELIKAKEKFNTLFKNAQNYTNISGLTMGVENNNLYIEFDKIIRRMRY